MNSRRQFLQAATAAAGLLALPGIPSASALLSRPGSRFERFANALHTPFEVDLDSESKVVLTLAEARLEQSGPETEHFSLRFHGPASTHLKQGAYRFEHLELGSSHIFIVPDGAGSGRPTYAAVFNCLKAPPEAVHPRAQTK